MGMSDPVVVAGAGPVGLLLACELARRGVPVRIVDKLAAPSPESRAIVVHARSLEMFERMGVLEEIVDVGARVDAMELRSGGDSVARIGFDRIDSPFPYSVVLPQTETERILTERLAGLGASVDRGIELVGLAQTQESVRVELRHSDGRVESVDTPWLAGTDGAHSDVRRLAGSALAGSFAGEHFLMGDVEAEHDLDPRAMHTFIAPDSGPLMAFPMRGHRMRLIAQVEPGDDTVTLERLQRVADERCGGIHVNDARWLTLFEIHHAQVPAYRTGRVFLAGDAAHVHSPAGGQGMNTGMQDSFNLGWKLALAYRGHASPTLLDSYHAERHPVAAKVIEFSTKLTDLATLDNAVLRTLRNHAMRAITGLAPLRQALADRVEETSLAYRHSPAVINAYRGPVRAGDHAPDVEGTDLRRAHVHETGHVLVTVAPADAVPDAIASYGTYQILVRGEGGPADGYDAVLPDPEDRVARRYGLRRGGRLAIRPDGYLGLITGLEGDAVAAYRTLVIGSR